MNGGDHDWLSPDGEPPSIPPAADAAGKTGVYRCDAEGETSSLFDTLIAATAEPPMSPEARIIAYTDAGPVLLAESTRDDERCGWRITMRGAVRLQREANGEAA